MVDYWDGIHWNTDRAWDEERLNELVARRTERGEPYRVCHISGEKADA